jgi:hypothetical protein
MKTAIVTTTINVPVLLRQYAENARYYGHQDLAFLVIGDRKSPPETAAFCRTLEQWYPCTYLDLAAQQKYLERFPELWAHLRFDSIQRRNIGLLLAYERGAEVVITVDDDNFVLGQDFVGLHGAAGTVRELPVWASTSGFFNVCGFLEADEGVRFYHRGYPLEERWKEAGTFVSCRRGQGRIAVNAGFWLDNPDIDALTRLERQPVVRGYKPHWQGNFALQPGTWSPFNSQNTALMRDVLPAYFLSPYIGRYDDIWAGYVIARIAQQLGDFICFGDPLVRQQRNPHDLWKDLDEERDGMILTGGFCRALRSVPLQGATYGHCFGEICAALGPAWQVEGNWTEPQKERRARFLEGLQIWRKVFEKLGD